MSGTHAHALYVPGDSAIHRVRPECKLLAQLLFVFAVVATPREAFWAFGVYAIILLTLMHVAGLPPRFVAKRLVIEVPFVLFAVLMPFLAHGEKVVVLGIPMYVSGLWAAWNILVKATLGLMATIVVSSTTPMADLLRGLERLHLPHAFTSIAGFMIRYLDVIAAEAQRMRVARDSRGVRPTVDLAGQGVRRLGRCVVHPLVRARRTRVPGDALARIHGPPARDGCRRRHRGHVGRHARVPGVRRLIAATAWAVQP